MRFRIVVCAVFLALPSSGFAQAERYELGRRMKTFEREWERADAHGRKRGLKMIHQATRQFLTFQLSAAARTLDESTLALADNNAITDADLWAYSLAVLPKTRLMDASVKSLAITVKADYSTTDLPEDAILSVLSALPRAEAPIRKLPLKLEFTLPPPFPAGSNDERLSVQIIAGGHVLLREIGISRVENLTKRLTALQTATRTLPAMPTIEQATAAERATLLTNLVAGEVFETDYPAARLLDEAETMIAPNAKPFFTAENPGLHWLTVLTAGKTATACRLFVPKGLDAKTPVPIVVGLHGMGGSENLFVEGYGAGCVAKACEKRGWLMLSPRSGLGFLGSPPPVAAIVEKLAERYPIDRNRVFLIGHSMGAAQAVDLAQKTPGKFAGLAVLGGGGRVRTAEPFKMLPTFIGVGSEDFALSGARSLRDALQRGGAQATTFREYAGIEHMVIVRTAVDDVFASFDRVAKGK